MKINIKQIDIDRGIIGDSHNCAIARALKRQFNTQDVKVSLELVRIKGTRYNLPKKASRFVARFDSDYNVEPFNFSLAIRKVKVGMANLVKKVSLLTK